MSGIKPVYTPSEKAQRRRLVGRGAWQTRGCDQFDDGHDAVDKRIHDRVKKIDDAAMKRGERVAAKLMGVVDAAEDAEADALAALRNARGADRAAARRALREAQGAVRRAKAEARKAGLNP